MSRLAPLATPLPSDENVAAAVGGAATKEAAAPRRRAALADVSNRRPGAGADGGAGAAVPSKPGTAGNTPARPRPALASLGGGNARPAPHATANAPPTSHAAAARTTPSLRVLPDAKPSSAPAIERLAGRSGAAQDAAADAVSAAITAARVAALAAGAARYPVPPLSEAARQQEAVRAFTRLDAEELARPPSPGDTCASPVLMLPAGLGAGGAGLVGRGASPSSAAADWGGDTPPAPLSDGGASTSSPSAAAAGPPSPSLADALAALDLKAGHDGSDFAACLADWDAAVGAGDGGAVAGLEVDGEWDGAVSPPQPEHGGSGGSSE